MKENLTKMQMDLLKFLSNRGKCSAVSITYSVCNGRPSSARNVIESLKAKGFVVGDWSVDITEHGKKAIGVSE